MARQQWWEEEEPWIPGERFSNDPYRYDDDPSSAEAVDEWWVKETVDRIYRRSDDSNRARVEEGSEFFSSQDECDEEPMDQVVDHIFEQQYWSNTEARIREAQR